MSACVLDASALLALLNAESGNEQVVEAMSAGAAISLVNLSEVVAKLSEAGMPEAVIHKTLDSLGLDMVSFDAALAYQAGLLRPLTRHAGLSLGDRACLALAKNLGLPALTADRAWESLSLGIVIRVIR
ncbi:MAG: type II toxin-antitoxin system VapC family toxin [Ktedonobacteraceae bacterium]|nr:type II toxin-antitoxin system VapC family toxin [Ktedonobacteraceae bacterium]